MKKNSIEKEGDVAKNIKRTLRHHLTKGLQNNHIFRLMFAEFKSWHYYQEDDITIAEISKRWKEFWSLVEIGYVFQHYATWYTQDHYRQDNEEWIVILINMCCVFEYELIKKYNKIYYRLGDATIFVDGKTLKQVENFY